MVQFLAFSLQDQVEKYGAYIGIAAFFGLAVLSILYFAQARELRRLRDWAGRAPERAAEMEARVVAQADAARRTPAVARPVPVAATAAAGGAGGGTPTASGEQATQVVDPPETGEHEAATSTNGTTEAAAEAPEAKEQEQAEHAGENGKAGEGTKAAGIAAGAAAAAAAAKAAEDKTDDEKAEDGEEEPAAEEEKAEAQGDEKPADEEKAEPEAEEKAEATPGEVPVAPVPRATPLPRRAPAPAAPLRQPTSSKTVPPRRPAQAQQRKSPVTPAASNPRSTPWALIGGGVAIVVLLVIVLLVTGVIGGGGSNPAPKSTSSTSTPSAGGTPSSGSGGGSSTAELSPEQTSVSVLNGTTIPGLASTERDKVVSAGFSKDKVTTGNNTDQQQAQSEVLYGTRDGARTQARTIARKLDIGAVQRLDADTRDLSSNADVVVILGQDKAP